MGGGGESAGGFKATMLSSRYSFSCDRDLPFDRVGANIALLWEDRGGPRGVVMARGVLEGSGSNSAGDRRLIPADNGASGAGMVS